MPLVGGQGWELNSINKPGGADYAHHITACPWIFTPSYGPEEQIDNDQDVGLVAK